MHPLTVVALSTMLWGWLSNSTAPTDRGASSQTSDQRERISVSDPRPLAKAAVELELRTHVAITYEDPPYVYDVELKDIASDARRAQGGRVMIPRGGEFAFDVDLPGTADVAAVRLALAEVLRQYRSVAGPGGFKVLQDNFGLHIVPTTGKDRAGMQVTVRSPLDVPLLPPTSQGSVAAFLREFVAALSATVGTRVEMGTVPDDVLMRTKVPSTLQAGTARDMLAEVLAATHTKLSWRLLYSPEEAASCYVLNIHPVERGPGNLR